MDRVEVMDLQGEEDNRELASQVFETETATAIAPIAAITVNAAVESLSCHPQLPRPHCHNSPQRTSGKHHPRKLQPHAEQS